MVCFISTLACLGMLICVHIVAIPVRDARPKLVGFCRACPHVHAAVTPGSENTETRGKPTDGGTQHPHNPAPVRMYMPQSPPGAKTPRRVTSRQTSGRSTLTTHTARKRIPDLKKTVPERKKTKTIPQSEKDPFFFTLEPCSRVKKKRGRFCFHIGASTVKKTSSRPKKNPVSDNGHMEQNHQCDDLVAQGPGRGHGAACTNRR